MKLNRILKRVGPGIGVFLGAVAAAGLLLFLVTQGDYRVPATVVDDPALSQTELNGLRFHYQIFGKENQELVIGLHGGPGEDHHYLEVMSELADRYRVVLYDQRGSGLSERVPDEELTMEGFIADLNAFVEHFSADDRAIIIGHSWGAMLAAAYAGAHPEKVSRLVLAKPGFLTPEKFREYMQRTGNLAIPINLRMIGHMLMTWFKSLHVKGPDPDARADFLYLNVAFGLPSKDHPLAGYWADPVEAMSSLHIDRFGMRAGTVFRARYLDEEGNLAYSFVENSRAYQKEVLFLSGEDNRIIGPDYQREQMRYFPKARLEVIPDAGHSMFNESPDYTFKVIREYLDR